MGMERWWNVSDKGKLIIRRQTSPSVTLSITDPIWTGLESNPGSLRREV